jgi:integrase
MQIEPMPGGEGWRCWLSEREQETLTGYYAEEPRKQLAVELMLDGLRSEETTRVSKQDFRRLDSKDGEAWHLRVWESKTGYREAPVSNETKQRAVMLANARGLRQEEPLVDVAPRTVQRWVTDAATMLAEETGDKDWTKVSAHDLRRTWATTTYYRLIANGGTNDVREIVMRWGGWDDEDTFRENYLGRVPDNLAANMMAAAGLV